MRSLQRILYSLRQDCLHLRHAARLRPGAQFPAPDSLGSRCCPPTPAGQSARNRCLPQLAHATSVRAAERPSPAPAPPAGSMLEIEDRLGQLSHNPMVRLRLFAYVRTLKYGRRCPADSLSPGTSAVLALKRDHERPQRTARHCRS